MGTSLRELEPQYIAPMQRFIRLLQALGYRVQVNSVRRDIQKQAEMYAAYLAGDPRYKHGVAPPGRSPHNLGIAVDMNIYRTSRTPPALERFDPYELAGAIWSKLLGFRWGGVFHPRDEIHFDFWPAGFVPPAGKLPPLPSARTGRVSGIR